MAFASFKMLRSAFNTSAELRGVTWATMIGEEKQKAIQGGGKTREGPEGRSMGSKRGKAN